MTSKPIKKTELKEHKSSYKNILNKSIFFVGVAGPLLTIPQLVKIYIEKNSAGVSLFSWAAYLIIAIIWLLYGIEHKEKPIIVTYASWILVEIFIVLGIILY